MADTANSTPITAEGKDGQEETSKRRNFSAMMVTPSGTVVSAEEFWESYAPADRDTWK